MEVDRPGDHGHRDGRLFAPFWETLAEHGDAPAIVESSTGRCWTYRSLAQEVSAGADQLAGGDKRLVLVCADNGLGFVLAYLSALRAGHAAMLVPPSRNLAVLRAVAKAYRPDALFATGPIPPGLLDGYRATEDRFGLRQWVRAGDGASPGLHAELALVLPTSGTSGRPKMARLSYSNIAANAHQIRLGLDMAPSSRAAGNLPLSYVFGLSMLNSHLASGGTFVLTRGSVLEPGFWRSVREQRVTALAGVSATFDLLRRIGFDGRTAPSLRQLLHSGGRLPPGTLAWARRDLSPALDLRLMYGMTEAAGRICMPPPGLVAAKAASVGRPVSFGAVRFSAESELIYSGPNVMLGYAESRSDLAGGDDLKGVLRTGDIGFADRDGDIFITGRTSRIFKVLGRRHSLDDVEECFSGIAAVAVARQGQVIRIFHSDGDAARLQERLAEVAGMLELPAAALRLTAVKEIPRTLSGKTDYDRLLRHSEPVREHGWGFLD